ncbi:DUF7681 family protein [Methylobrevis pamukkalensis]|uniref:Acb2/Tad1 hairpin domain-containing protein n=1 Tax=Methylobrevis pamukkalensis TaxID=1439726 RepID=A0A1E3H7C5_9HYPH|nr:hypothetical protein [Methylobrevis pamukkalensis]ODN72204.1 hypothetical protein A6302_00502 [Methylobrevis pamukkalensis]
MKIIVLQFADDDDTEEARDLLDAIRRAEDAQAHYDLDPDDDAPTHVSSTGDDRIANNAVRHTYRVLSEAEKLQMQSIKDLGAAFIAKLHEIGGTNPAGDSFVSRNLSLANTHAEDAVMRAVRHITA